MKTIVPKAAMLYIKKEDKNLIISWKLKDDANVNNYKYHLVISEDINFETIKEDIYLNKLSYTYTNENDKNIFFKIYTHPLDENVAYEYPSEASIISTWNQNEVIFYMNNSDLSEDDLYEIFKENNYPYIITADGHWGRYIYLPSENILEGQSIKVKRTATYATDLIINGKHINLKKGVDYTFVFTDGQWISQQQIITYMGNSKDLTKNDMYEIFKQTVYPYIISANGNWGRNINLPKEDIKEGQRLKIKRTAAYATSLIIDDYKISFEINVDYELIFKN
jgi:hypothetical protein